MTRHSAKVESALARHINRLDEYSFLAEDGVEQEVVEFGEKAIEAAGKALKLALPLKGEGKKAYMGSWRDVH